MLATGNVKQTFAELEYMPETCSLDVADRGGSSFDDLGAVLNLTRERARQIAEKAVLRLRKVARLNAGVRELADGKAPPDGRYFMPTETSQRVVDRMQSGATDGEDEGADESIDEAPRAIWDLSREETHLRAQSAERRAYAAYLNASIAHGHERVSSDPKFREELVRIENHLAQKKESDDMDARLSQEARATRTDMILSFLRDRGPSRPRDLVEVLGVNIAICGKELRTLAAQKVIAGNGIAGKGCLYGVLGADFRVARSERKTATPERVGPPKKRSSNGHARANGHGDPKSWGHVEGVAALEERVAQLRGELSGLEQALTIIRAHAS